MSAAYLEHYLDSLEQLPVELQRNFLLMRELDARSQEILRAIDRTADTLLIQLNNDTSCNTKISNEDKRGAITSIQAQYVKVREYADDKVQLAIQTYELVDKHIRKLDSDLARFECEIQERQEKMSELPNVANNKRKQTTSQAIAGRKKMQEKESSVKKMMKKKKKLPITSPGDESSASQTMKISKKKKKIKDTSGTDDADENERTKSTEDEIIDMPVDPNEPVYCLCQQVSYGQMIGCDYPDCPIEWFHFACVNLTVKPKGKWFCPKCTTDKKMKK